MRAGAAERPAAMPLDRLLRLLVCPACRWPVQPGPGSAGLRCPECRRTYPIIEGVPILLTETSRALLSLGLDGSPPRAAAAPAWRAALGRLLRAVSHGGSGRDPGQETRIRRMLNGLGDDAAVLDLGSGGRRWGASVISMDIDRFPGVGLIGDGHRLPFSDGSLDGVICTGVLEHVQDAEAVTREIRRVLRPGGLAYVSVPFIQGFHPGSGTHMDYRRLTHVGLQQQLAAFERVESGLSGGPSAALAWILREYLALLCFDGGRGHSAAYLAAGWLTCWLPVLDRLLRRREKAHRIACGFYLVGRKPAGPLPTAAEDAA